MKIEEILAAKLLEFEQRIHSVQIGKDVTTSLCYGLSVYLALYILGKFIFLPLNWLVFFLVICGLSVVIGLFVEKCRHICPFSVACRVDETLTSKERISTAWEYKDQKRSNKLVPLLIKDTVGHLQGVKAKKVFPYQWLKRGKYVLYISAGILLVSFTSHLPLPSLKEIASSTSTSLQKEGQSLMRFSKKLTEKEQLERLEQERQAPGLIEQMRQLGDEMHRRELEEEGAFQAYNSLESEVSQAIHITQNELLNKLKSLAEEGGGDSIDEKKLSQVKEALQKEDYENLRKLLGEASMKQTGKDESEEISSYLKELEALSAMRQALRESRQRLHRDLPEEKDEKGIVRTFNREGDDLASGEGNAEGYGSAKDEDSLLESELAKRYASLPGYSSSWQIQEEKVLEFDEEGNLVKVKGQFDQGSLLMGFLRNISRSSDKPGLPTQEAFISYGKLMMNKLAGEKIPLSYKEQVKKYFSSLEPE